MGADKRMAEEVTTDRDNITIGIFSSISINNTVLRYDSEVGC